MALALLEELRDLQMRVTDPDWLERIGDKEEDTPQPRQTRVQARAAMEKAKVRREKKTAAQRSRGAEGRA